MSETQADINADYVHVAAKLREAGTRQTPAEGHDGPPPEVVDQYVDMQAAVNCPVDRTVSETERPAPLPFLNMSKPVRLADPIVDGLLRVGETMNIIAPSKAGKSWLLYSLLFALAYGLEWFGRPCREGRVLLVDNELHGSTLLWRLNRMHKALVQGGLVTSTWDDVRERIHVVSLRGRLQNIDSVTERLIAHVDREAYQFVALDALYRFVPSGVSENDNAAMANIYNTIDRMALELSTSAGLVHHSSKGAQGDKRATDVGAGAGAIARAADSHVILREHEQDDAVVMEAPVRSFPPVEPVVCRFEFPQWSLADGLHAGDLKGAKTRTTRTTTEIQDDIVEFLRDECDGPVSKQAIRESCDVGGKVKKYLLALRKLGRVRAVHHETGEILTRIKGNREHWEYAESAEDFGIEEGELDDF